MELPGGGYLLALAALGMGFVGFASLVILFLRPATGRPLTAYDAFFTLSFAQLGFVIVLGSLLPPLLALYGLAGPAVWRVASAVTAIPFTLFCLAAPLRRRAAGDVPGETYFGLMAIPHLVSLTGLVLTAAGVRWAPDAAAYATVMTLILATSGVGYLLGLRVLLREAPPRSR